MAKNLNPREEIRFNLGLDTNSQFAIWQDVGSIGIQLISQLRPEYNGAAIYLLPDEEERLRLWLNTRAGFIPHVEF